jgi:FtsP/CotA-like multicopper oxidase with cupredoxin domain
MVAAIRRRKRSVTAVTACLAALVGVYIGMRTNRHALATSGGDAYSVPLAVDTNPDPNIFETTISAEAHTVDIGQGQMANVLTFNGTIPGPQIVVKVGDTVIVHFKNNIAHPTGIHWHGIELDNISDGTPLTQNIVPPGGTYLYKFKVTRPGIYWYHPHHHSSTNQVFKGLYGTFIVKSTNEETLQSAGTIPPESLTKTFALSDITVCKASGNSSAADTLCNTAPIDEDGNPRGPFAVNDVPNIQLPGTAGQVNEGEIVLLNGKNVGGRAGAPDDNPLGDLDANAETMNVLAGQTIRLRIGSEATVRFYRLRLTGSDGTNTVQVPLVRIGGENGLLNKAKLEGGIVSGFDFGYDSGEVLLDPGDRIDVVATFPPTATGVFTLWEKNFVRQGSNGPNLPTVPVAHFKINGSMGVGPTIAAGTPILSSLGAGAEVEVLGGPLGGLLDPSGFSPTKKGMNNPDIQLTNHSSMSLGINQVIGEHDFSGDYTAAPRPEDTSTHVSSARWAKLGDTLELTVTNMTGAHHPFHLHGFSMQPISLIDTMSGPPPLPNGGGDKSPGIGPPYMFPVSTNPDFRDTIDVPPGYTLTFRVRLDDRPQMDGVTPGGGLGRWVFHCHIFFHASFGMISEFDVVSPNGNERPYINADDTDLSGNSGDTLTMHGTYVDPDGDTPIALSASTGSISDDGDGKHWTWTGSASASTLVYVTATDPNNLNGQTAFGLKINVPPVLTVPGPQTQDYHDPLSFSVSATDADNDPITLSVTGLPAGLSFVDNGNGTGNVSGTLTATPGVYTATFAASDGHNPAVKKDVKITVTREETVTVYTGPTVILNGGSVLLSATLKEDGTVPIDGRAVNFTLGAQSCNGSTHLPDGVASCTLVVNSPLGSSIPITAAFAGDAFYLPSSASATAVVFAFPPGGSFVVGDTSAAGGGTVTWWDSQWAKTNTFSDGTASSAMKGFAPGAPVPTTTPPAACGGPWSTTGGSSPPPPTSGIPAFMGVFTTNSATKSGSSISGNTVSIVVVQTNPGYAPNAGGNGTGTVIATFCHQ